MVELSCYKPSFNYRNVSFSNNSNQTAAVWLNYMTCSILKELQIPRCYALGNDIRSRESLDLFNREEQLHERKWKKVPALLLSGFCW